MTDLRAALRVELRARRAALDGVARFTAARAVAGLLDLIPAFVAARRVAGYWAVAGELPLSVVVASINRDRERTFFLPCVPERGIGVLSFAPWAVGEPVTPNRFGIPEPQGNACVEAATLDVVLVPIVGFDRRGSRLGSGGGYYDRTFAIRQHAPAPPLLIGIGFACQQIDLLEPAAWDVDLDWVVTEHEVIDCARLRALDHA